MRKKENAPKWSYHIDVMENLCCMYNDFTSNRYQNLEEAGLKINVHLATPGERNFDFSNAICLWASRTIIY